MGKEENICLHFKNKYITIGSNKQNSQRLPNERKSVEKKNGKKNLRRLREKKKEH